MKKIIVGLMVMIMFTVVWSDEFPYTSDTRVHPGQGFSPRDAQTRSQVIPHGSLWASLKRLSLEERANAEISLVLAESTSNAARQLARQIETLWNNEQFDEALALFPQLATLTNLDEAGIGIRWRTPLETDQSLRWGQDVQIGNRDSALVVAMDIHRASGHLFCAVLREGDGNTNRWNVYFSSDGGNNWVETYDWWANYNINDLDAAVVAEHFYVGFSRGGNQDQAFLYRFRAANGSQVNFNNGTPFITVFTTTPPEAIEEVALAANQDYFNNRLYYSAITNMGSLKFFWSDTETVNWIEIPTNVTNAEEGLDVASNENFSGHYCWLSYFVGDTVQIDGVLLSDTWDQLMSYPVGTSVDYTSIGAWGDTVTCFFDYHGDVLHVRYLVSYNGGQTWLWGFVDDTTTTHESPAMTARGGGGVGEVHRFYTSPREGRFSYRFYRGLWDPPVHYTDVQLYWNQPAIEYLGSGVYGVVYLTWNNPGVRLTYFDRSDWITSIADPQKPGQIPGGLELAQNFPNPFNPATEIRFSLPAETYTQLDIYNATGQKVASLIKGKMSAGEHQVTWNAEGMPSGIYFYKLSTPTRVLTKKMVLLK